MSILTDTRNTREAWSGRASASSSWEAAGWSEAGQTQRFLAVLRHLDLRDGETLLDYGAGTGRFCEFVPRGVSYHAHDWSEAMLQRVARDHPRAEVHIELPPILFDHVVCIGTFNLPGSVGQTYENLANLWHDSTRRSLVASLYRGSDPSCMSYEPETLAAWAKAWGVKRYVVDASHLDNDVILVLRR